MYETVNVPLGANCDDVVVLTNGDTVLGLGPAPAMTADTALVPATENETVCPAQTGFGEATTVPVGPALTVKARLTLKLHPSVFRPVKVNKLFPPSVGVTLKTELDTGNVGNIVASVAEPVRIVPAEAEDA